MSKKIHIVFGRQGAGKTKYSQSLAKQTGGVYFSIDEWMWTLYGEDLPPSMSLTWINKRIERCEKQIWKMTMQLTALNIHVILDLGFTKFEKRTTIINQAAEMNIPVQIHYLEASYHVRKKRVLDRNKEKGDTFVFEVTEGMFDFMEGEFQIPRETELKEAIVINTEENSIQ